MLPLRDKVGWILPDSHYFNSITPTCINNALKRKRQEQLETCRDGALSVEVIAQFRSPNSYCMKEWSSRLTGQQLEKLQPLFEASVLM